MLKAYLYFRLSTARLLRVMDESTKDNSQPSTSGTSFSSYPDTELTWYQDLDEEEALRIALTDSLLDCPQVNEFAWLSPGKWLCNEMFFPNKRTKEMKL